MKFKFNIKHYFLSYLKSLNPNRWSISTKLLVALFSASIIPMSLIAYHNLNLSLQHLTQSAYYKLEIIAVSKASRIDQLIINNRLTINQVAKNALMADYLTGNTTRRNNLNSQVQKDLNIVLSSSSDYDAVFILDKNGICQASTDPALVGQDYSFRDYFKQAMKGQGTAPVDLQVGLVSDRPELFFAHPIRIGGTDTLGVAVLKIHGTDVWKVINSLMIHSHAQTFLIDEHGIVLAHPHNSFLYRSLDSLPQNVKSKLEKEKFYGRNRKISDNLKLTTLANTIVGARQVGHLSYSSPIDQTEQIVGFAPLDTEPWVVAVNKPKAIFEARMKVLIWKNVFFLLLVGTVVSLVSLWLSYKLGRSIRILIEAGKALYVGNFSPGMLTKISRSQDDLGTLAQVFLKMADEINNRERHLKSQVKHLQVKVDDTKKERQIAEITGTEYFQELQKKARRLKNRTKDHEGNGYFVEGEYFEDLNQKVKSQKERFITNLKKKFPTTGY